MSGFLARPKVKTTSRAVTGTPSCQRARGSRSNTSVSRIPPGPGARQHRHEVAVARGHQSGSELRQAKEQLVRDVQIADAVLPLPPSASAPGWLPAGR